MFPTDLIQIISNYIPDMVEWADNLIRNMPTYQLNLRYIQSCWNNLSLNPSAVHILEQNLDKVNWTRLSLNEGAVHILEQNLDKVNWQWLSRNKSAIHLIEANLDKVDWYWLSANEGAVHILEQNLNRVRWDGLSRNKSAIHLIEANLDKVDWYWLSANEGAIHLLEKYPDKVNQDGLSENPYIVSMQLLENLNQIDTLMINRVVQLEQLNKLDPSLNRPSTFSLRFPSIFINKSIYQEELSTLVW